MLRGLGLNCILLLKDGLTFTVLRIAPPPSHIFGVKDLLEIMEVPKKCWLRSRSLRCMRRNGGENIQEIPGYKLFRNGRGSGFTDRPQILTPVACRQYPSSF